MSEGLEYVVVQVEPNEVQVWTPDTTGACIGSGKTREEALVSAIRCMAKTIATLAKLLK